MIISGLKETFINRYRIERTNKAGIRPEEQNEKAASCRETAGNTSLVQCGTSHSVKPSDVNQRIRNGSLSPALM